jgi:hypothetical protein
MIEWPTEQPPMVVVVVDTEAEFDWVRQRPRRAMGVTSVKSQMQVQRIFERYQVRPTYVLDYPVSSTPEGYEFIRNLHSVGACEVGAHLQPWDNPPFFERKTDENSYPGNLPFELEREKLVRLTRSIEENVGVRPRIYKAGRYGVGRATARILAELGYEIDMSVVPGTDLSHKLGPDFTHCRAGLYLDDERTPESAACTGHSRPAPPHRAHLADPRRCFLRRAEAVDPRAAAQGSSGLQLHLSQPFTRPG